MSLLDIRALWFTCRLFVCECRRPWQRAACPCSTALWWTRHLQPASTCCTWAMMMSAPRWSRSTATAAAVPPSALSSTGTPARTHAQTHTYTRRLSSALSPRLHLEILSNWEMNGRYNQFQPTDELNQCHLCIVARLDNMGNIKMFFDYISNGVTVKSVDLNLL